jgi:hypothetical protein
MSLISTVANFGGRQPDNNQNTKSFVVGPTSGEAIWVYKRTLNTLKVQTPANKNTPVLIANDLYVTGAIYNPSDKTLKENIESIEEIKIKEFKNLEPKIFNYKDNPNKKHYGFIAQEMEEIYPELVKDSSFGYKTINYIELIPLLVLKINEMQKEIDELKENSNCKK